VQHHRKHLGTLSIIIRVALVTTRVRIVQGVKRQANVCCFFILRSIIATMAAPAALFACVDGMPFPLIKNGMCRRMTRTA
jgi:hypothetical protein